MHDFDFLHGTWRVTHRKLRERLTGSGDWLTLTGPSECRPVLRGIGNIDRITLDGNDEWEGMTWRLFDLKERCWRIHWSDTSTGRLDPPLTGTFDGGTGVFYGYDTHDGTPVRVRFIWRSIDESHARWEQAFSADGGGTWEVNWIMDFTRT